MEKPRMSVKRLLRRKAAGQTDPVDQSGEALPPRTWEGMVDRFPLGDVWMPKPPPAEGEEPPAEDEDAPVLSPEVESFRSPAHKRLFKERDEKVAMYQDSFKENALRMKKTILEKRRFEEQGQGHWSKMVGQLLQISSED